MPPDNRLPAAAVALLTEWVRQGAPWPETRRTGADHAAAAIGAAWKNHWAAQPVRPQELPAVRDAGWVASPVDRFILARLEQNDLAPSPPADRRTLLRRATFDLIGLPPTPEEIAAFEADTAPGAFERVVERLLASPHYGERWGRHWLDVARYADTKEYVRLKEERRLLFAFTYRDYVTRAFNADLPYDQFVLEQLAADLLPAGDDRRCAGRDGLFDAWPAVHRQPARHHRRSDRRHHARPVGFDGHLRPLPRSQVRSHSDGRLLFALRHLRQRRSAGGAAAHRAGPPIRPLEAEQKEIQPARRRWTSISSKPTSGCSTSCGPTSERIWPPRSRDAGDSWCRCPPIPGEVRHFVAERWLDCLEADERAAAPALVPWRALTAIGPKEDFASRRRRVLAELAARDGSDPAAPRANSLVLSALEARAAGIDDRRGPGLWRSAQRRLSSLAQRDRAEQPDRQRQLRAGRLDRPTFRPPAGNWPAAGFARLSSEGATEGDLAAVFGDGTAESQPPTAHTAAISQTVATRPGVRYRLSCDFAVYGSGAEAHAQTLGVRVAGSQPLVEQTVSRRGQRPGELPTLEIGFRRRRSVGDRHVLGQHGQRRERIGRRRAGQRPVGGTVARGQPLDRCSQRRRRRSRTARTACGCSWTPIRRPA